MNTVVSGNRFCIPHMNVVPTNNRVCIPFFRHPTLTFTLRFFFLSHTTFPLSRAASVPPLFCICFCRHPTTKTPPLACVSLSAANPTTTSKVLLPRPPPPPLASLSLSSANPTTTSKVLLLRLPPPPLKSPSLRHYPHHH